MAPKTPTSEPADVCANCGVVGGDSVKLKKCTGCLLVKYCGASCQKAHRATHKRECMKRAAKLREEKLLETPSVEWDECPVCFLRMPFEQEKISYNPCCGKEICHGCADTTLNTKIFEGFNRPDGKVDFNKALDNPCPFCRSVCPIKIEDRIGELDKRVVDTGDPRAMYHLAIMLMSAPAGCTVPAGPERTRELLLRSAKSGYPLANLSVGMFYYDGKYPAVFEKNQTKARRYFEVGALGGDPIARAYLGEMAMNRFDIRTATHHYMIAASCGYELALDNVLNSYKNGYASKDEYATTLRAFKAASDELSSKQRSRADKMHSELGSDSNVQPPPELLGALDLLKQMRNMGTRDGPVSLFGGGSVPQRPQQKK